MGLTRTEVDSAAISLYEEVTRNGESERSVAELFGWDEATYERVRTRMLEIKAEQYRARPREHVYVEFVIQQQRNIRDLDEVIRKLDKTKMHAASIGAIRLRADIQSSVIEKGQEFGLIKKEAERKELVGGLFVADLTRGQLTENIVKELSTLKDYMERFGDSPITDVKAPRALHYGKPAAPIMDAEAEEMDEPEDVAAPKTKRGSRR
jgi:hypothetical protein